MHVITYFTQLGVPKTGLVPTIEIWRVRDNVKIVNASTMGEVGGGFYKYEFSSYDPQENYAIKCDAGASLSNSERYSFAGNEGFHDDIVDIQSAIETMEVLVRRILGLSQENYRLFDCHYDSTGTRLESCTIKIYNNKTDCDNNLNAFSTYSMQSVYGQDGQLSSYKVTKEG